MAQLRQKIAEAATQAGRRPEEVGLLAVSKTFPLESIREVFAAGQRHFGENYVQEARQKAEIFSEPCWHLIGPLQRNKINQALEIFSYFHSIDSLDLLRAVDLRAAKAGKRPKILLQVRLGEEESKNGFAPDNLILELKQLRESPPASVDLVGLMSIPPAALDPEDNRVHFRHLARLAQEIRQLNLPFFQEFQLSMGMSDDFAVAIQEGASWVRVGRALFGYRALKNA